MIVGDRHRVEFADAVVAVEHAARIFPGDRATGLDLRPRYLAALALTQRALGHEIIDAALALGVAGVPVLDGRIFDLGIVERDQRSEEHTSELQSLMRISYAVFCLKKKTKSMNTTYDNNTI